MIIPDQHDFKCRNNPDDELNVDIRNKDYVYFSARNAAMIEDPEQIALIRDMLTAWLSGKDRRVD